MPDYTDFLNVRPAAYIGKAANPQRHFFELAFGFIPTFNPSVPLGIKNPVGALITDVLLDPLNVLTSGATKLGRAAKAGLYLSRADKVEDAVKMVNAAHWAQREPEIARTFMRAVQTGDAKTLSGLASKFDMTLPETRKFFRGEKGRAILDAIEEGGEVTLQKGAAAQAAAGQRRLLGIRSPWGTRWLIGDHEFTIPGLSGKTVFSLAQKIPGIGPKLANVGAKDISRMRTLLAAAPATTQAVHELANAGRALDEAAAVALSGDSRSIAAHQASESFKPVLDEVRKAYAEFVNTETAERIAHESPATWAARLEADADVLGVKFLEKTPGRTSDVAPFVSQVARAIESSQYSKHLDTVLDAAEKTVSQLAVNVQKGAVQDALNSYAGHIRQAKLNPHDARELAGLESVRATFREQAAAQAAHAVEARQATEQIAPQTINARGFVESASPEAAKAFVEGQQAIALQENAKLDRKLTRATQNQQAVEKVLATLPEGLQKYDTAHAALFDKIRVAGDRLLDSLESLKKLDTNSAARLEPQLQAISRSIATLSGTLAQSGGIAVAKEFTDKLRRIFPALADTSVKLQNVGVNTELEALIDDVLSGLNPAASTDYGNDGRAVLGLYGTSFNPLNLADAHYGFRDTLLTRIAVMREKLENGLELVKREGPERVEKFMLAFEDPGLQAQLLPHELSALKSMERTLKGFEQIGHGRWWDENISHYLPRIVKKAPGVSQVEYVGKLAALRSKASAAKATTRHAKPRMVETLQELFELEKQGILTVERDPSKLFFGYIEGWADVAANQRLVDTAARSRAMDGLPVLLRKEDAEKMLKRVGANVQQTLRRYKGDLDTRAFPILGQYYIHPDHAEQLTKVFGPQSLGQAVRETDPALFRNLQLFNLGVKGGMLQMSLFHKVALNMTLAVQGGLKGLQFIGSDVRRTKLAYMALGTTVGGILGAAEGGLAGAAIGAGVGALGVQSIAALPHEPGALRASKLLELWGEAGETVEQAISHGLEFDSFSRYESEVWKGFVDELTTKLNASKVGDTIVGPGGTAKVVLSPITGLKHFNDFVHTSTWEITHNSGKVWLYAHNLQQLAKKFPDRPLEELGRQAAASANSALGGLGWRKMFGDIRVKQYLQFFMLAPDWTLANLLQARDAAVGFFGHTLPKDASGRTVLPLRDIANPSAAATIARKFWINAAVGVFGTMQLINYALTGHSTFDNPGGPEGKFAVFTGQYDPQNGQPIYLHTGKQFFEPFQLVLNPVGFVRRRASPVVDAIATVTTQRDRYMRPISLPEDSTAVAILKNAGYLVSRAVPIPFREGGAAAYGIATGDPGAKRELLNAFTSTLDIGIRPLPPPKKAKAPEGENDNDLTSTLPRDVVPAREVRFLVPEFTTR